MACKTHAFYFLASSSSSCHIKSEDIFLFYDTVDVFNREVLQLDRYGNSNGYVTNLCMHVIYCLDYTDIVRK